MNMRRAIGVQEGREGFGEEHGGVGGCKDG